MDFLKMSMPPGSTIASYVASIRHATYRLEECYQAEEDDPISVSSTTKPLIVSNLDKISVLLNGLPPAYQPVIVNITGTPLASLTFEAVVTRLMNEEGRLHNVVSMVFPTQATPSDSRDEAYATAPSHVPRWKGKSSKSTPAKDMSKVICHKCGGVGHIRPHCPTPDSDAANVAVDEEDEEQTFTAIPDEVEEAW